MGDPVTQQPASMGSFGYGAGVPPGLAYLSQVDQLLVQQQMELCEIFSGCETNNRYIISNTLGQQVFSGREDTNWCTRQCCGPIRPFDIQVQDGSEREVLTLRRPLRCQGCCCPCCLQQMEVVAADGQLLGSIRERWTFIKPKLTVHDASGRHVFTIRGPICKCSCGGDVLFRILTADDEQEVGSIRKQWSGVLREMVTDSDTFSVSFPIDLDVSLKATLLGALLLVDFMFFEYSN
ncbi:Phospholipid scramblase 2 [Amphibalanus amphitrite]|uniref:Phospholipid scramblase n=1 Tax=Amphibalanus amphitrite TaxID=1232801 RepID=A0A6A4VMK1_AMPAM|nr:Phospholipid scramblase 2 [Amphibalanus amphitrite]